MVAMQLTNWNILLISMGTLILKFMQLVLYDDITIEVLLVDLNDDEWVLWMQTIVRGSFIVILKLNKSQLLLVVLLATLAGLTITSLVSEDLRGLEVR